MQNAISWSSFPYDILSICFLPEVLVCDSFPYDSSDLSISAILSFSSSFFLDIQIYDKTGIINREQL